MSHIQILLDIMARLRSADEGCPWDREQNFRTIAPYTLEEAYEVADAIERNDMAELRSELGDLLFQVVFHAQMAKEAGEFDFGDVVAAISEKMIRRHPHVFGDAKIENATEQTQRWEDIKAQERVNKDESASALQGVSVGLPALTRARKLQGRAARVGFDWPNVEQVLDKLDEELGEVREALALNDADAIEDELGDLLFVCVNVARHVSVDPEAALRRANQKFERRFRYMEMLATTRGFEFAKASLDAQEALWQEAKMAERRVNTDEVV